MIIRARAVVTMDGAPIPNGAVVVEGNKIADVGSWEEVSRRFSGEVIDLGERALLPGLINAHCHLDYTNLRGAIPPPLSFTEWIRAINAQKATWTEADYLRSIETGFAEAARFGTTTIANLEAFPDLLAAMAPPPIRTWWFGEMIDIREDASPVTVAAKLSDAIAREGWLGGGGLAPHAPYTASKKLYTEANAAADRQHLIMTTHLAESREEFEMFRSGDGPLFQFVKSLGRSMEDCGSQTPVEIFLNLRLLNERWIVAHLNELSEGDLALLAPAPRFHIAHCPRSHAYFGHRPFDLIGLRRLGFNVCLGTDSLASNQDLSLFAEMRQLARTQPTIRASELMEMITTKAAAAIQQSEVLGRIRTGHYADMIAVPSDGAGAAIYEDILGFEGNVPWLMVDGRHRST